MTKLTRLLIMGLHTVVSRVRMVHRRSTPAPGIGSGTVIKCFRIKNNVVLTLIVIMGPTSSPPPPTPLSSPHLVDVGPSVRYCQHMIFLRVPLTDNLFVP